MVFDRAFHMIGAARELVSWMRQENLNGAMETLRFAAERNERDGWASYDNAEDLTVIQVRFSDDELTLIVGAAVTLKTDSEFYETLLAPEEVP